MRVPGSPVLGLQVVVSNMTWVLGTEPGFLTTESSLKHDNDYLKIHANTYKILKMYCIRILK